MAEPSGNVIGTVERSFTKNAHLEILAPSGSAGTKIPLCFNPTELQLAKQNTFAEIAIPGLDVPPLQFVRGVGEKLTFDAIVDTSDSMEDVRKKYVNEIRKLLDIDKKIHAPPIVRFIWEDFSFIGVFESLNVTYTLFSDAGRPVRAKLGIALKQYREKNAEPSPLTKKESSDVEKVHVVQRGETLSGIAEQAYGDPVQWREIARANGIVDPRTLEPGRVLTIPRLVRGEAT
ncbi:MAG TPA: LysM peptidoglycan-binding domain-containing protein [Kofleriaceae bacterium]|nr:LysM peptidoglycan-binding domain-containing protein [Kofleriaceae bacterium]